jgi:mono/diheme cytochrome c family protein
MKEKKVGPPMEKAFEDVQIAAQTIRVGSQAMPFYAKDVLTDQQIADVVAYVQEQLGK